MKNPLKERLRKKAINTRGQHYAEAYFCSGISMDQAPIEIDNWHLRHATKPNFVSTGNELQPL